MKSIKLSLAVLMLAAAFTACTKEEFAPTQDIQKGEFVGAKLIGSNLSVDFIREGETKVDANGDWINGDEAGLAWIVNGSYDADQATTQGRPVGMPTVNTPFANHLFVMGDTDFTTYGNVYEGWHFGYYPYQYMAKVGVNMAVEINPTQKDVYDIDQYKTRLHLSALNFLTAENNLDVAGKKLKNTELKLRRAVKTIRVGLKPTSTFTNSTALNDLAITKVQFDYTGNDANFKPFSVGDEDGKVVLNLVGLDSIKNNQVTLKYDEDLTEAAFYTCLPSVWSNAVKSKSIFTSVDNSEIDLSGDQVVRVYTLPFKDTDEKLSAETIKLTVSVEAGEFTISYVDPDSDDFVTGVDDVNNACLKKLANAYKNDGYMTSFTKDNDKQVLGLDFILAGHLFEAKFNNISSERAWNTAVKMVDALGKNEVEFTIVKNGRNKWAFTDEDGDGNLINLPANAELTVKGTTGATAQNLILNAVGQWPDSEDFNVDINVEVRKDLTVEGVMNVTSGNMIYNGATIYAGEKAELGNKPAPGTPYDPAVARFQNNLPQDISELTKDLDGTVVVKYGAYVYPNSVKGVIAYKVESTTASDILKINRLLGIQSTEGLANVNTLIVKTVLDINALAVAGIENDDRYENTGVNGRSLTHLTGTKDGVTHEILVKLEGGSLVHKLTGDNTEVGEVIAVSGVNTLDDVIVTDDITVNEGATLNIINTVTDLAKTYFYGGAIENAGTINTNNVSLNLEGAVVNEGSIKVENGDLWYTGSIENDGSMSGKINSGQTNSFVVNSEAGIKEAISKISTATDKVTVTLADNITLKDQLEFNTNREATLDLNGKTISNTTDIWDATLGSGNNKVSLIKISGGKKVTIKGNGIVEAKKNDVYGVYVTGNNSELIIENGTFIGNVTAVQVDNGAKLLINGGTFNLKQLSPDDDYRYMINAIDSDYIAGTTINVKGGSFYKFNPAANLAEGATTNFLYKQGDVHTVDGVNYRYVSTKDGDWYKVSRIVID